MHTLEVRNAILQRAFHQRRSIASSDRENVARERDAAFSRLQHYLTRRTLLDVTLDMEPAIARAAKLSAAHTERLGARAIDLLHVACALTLESELFLTTDTLRQAAASQGGRFEGRWRPLFRKNSHGGSMLLSFSHLTEKNR